jgi:hypothetical protein
MDRPKALAESDWMKIRERYRMLNGKRWDGLDGVKKVEIMKECGIPTFYEPAFGIDFKIVYPNNIYKFSKAKSFELNPVELVLMRDSAQNEKHEIGGIVDFTEYKNIQILFIGTNTRIDLNLEESTQDKMSLLLFHTHPADTDVEFDPPSILDIISFLSFNVKSLADLILNPEKSDTDKVLKIQVGIVFTKNEVYTYYMSHHLIVKIILHLREINLQGNFIEDSEKLLEEIELYYTSYLLKFNILLNGKKVDDYCRTLATLGILMHRATYSEGCNCFIF